MDNLNRLAQILDDDDDVIDLTDIVKTGSPDDEDASPWGALNDGPVSAAPSDEDLDMPSMNDVDELLRNLVVPEQPSALEEEEELGMEDLGGVLADLDESFEPAKPVAEDLDDLDELLNAIVSEDEPTAAPEDDPMADLEALLKSSGSPAAVLPPEMPVIPDLPEDNSPPPVMLDDDANEPENPLLIGVTQDVLDEWRDAVQDDVDAVRADVIALGDRVTGVENALTTPVENEPAALDDVKAELDDVKVGLDDVRAGLDAARSDMEEMAETQAQGLASAEGRISVLEADSAEKAATAQEIAFAERLAEAEALIASLQSEVRDAAGPDVSAWSARLAEAEASIGALNGIVSDQTEPIEGLTHRLTGTEATMERLREELAEKAEINAELAARLASLEDAWAARSDVEETLLSRLAALEASQADALASLGTEAAGAFAESEHAALESEQEERLAALEAAQTELLDKMEARLDPIAARLNALEGHVDKAAAEAAARVIREEIAALLMDMGQD